jgi:hypothetical protein
MTKGGFDNVWVVIVYAKNGFGWAGPCSGADWAADAFVWVNDCFVHVVTVRFGAFLPDKKLCRLG